MSVLFVIKRVTLELSWPSNWSQIAGQSGKKAVDGKLCWDLLHKINYFVTLLITEINIIKVL